MAFRRLPETPPPHSPQSMGLLATGRPLTWEEASEHREYVREHGVTQFINTFARCKDMAGRELLWGDEIEYGIFVLDEEAKTVKLSLRSEELLQQLIEKEVTALHRQEGCTWVPEYGKFMLEATPRGPFSGYVSDLLRVERNMRLRRKRLLSCLRPKEIAPTVTCLPVMGVGDFTSPSAAPGGPASESEFLPDALINPHPRFAALTRSIRMRRGSKVSIDVPLFKDVATPEYAAPFSADSPPSVHMDAMGFGMGCCCSQVTFQARDCDESRFLYDQLAVLSPIMLALTASTPILRGRLVDTDVRWGVISASVDDRTPAERGVEGGAGGDDSMAGQGSRRLYKSRYASISSYLHFCRRRPDNPMYVLDHYNDIPCPTDPATEERLLKEGLDAALAHHVAHLFVRDPLVIFEGRTSEVSDEDSTDHWENIQSTNWQTVRWKPPPPLPPPEASAGGTPPPLIGWRTEFRSMEVQLTDFENAAYVVFVVLVTRVILAFDLNLYVPLSKVDANMERAHARGSVLGEKFYWRMHMAPPEGDDSHAGGDVEGGESEAQAAGHLAARPCKTNGVAACKDKSKRVACALGYEEMTIQEILLGKGSYYPGLIPLVYAYLDHIGCDSGTFEKVDAYLNLIKCRATGELSTAATFMRNFVQSHPDYKGDSVVSQSISYDLMRLCDDVGKGRCACPDLLGDIVIHPVLPETAYDVPLASSRVSTAQTRELLQKYTSRGAWNERSGVEGPGRPMRPGNGDDLFLDMGLISRTPSLSFY